MSGRPECGQPLSGRPERGQPETSGSRRPNRPRRRLAAAVLSVIVVALVVAACGRESEFGAASTTTSKKGSPTTADTGEGDTPAALMTAVCEGAPEITDAGVVDVPEINEASGLVASWSNTGDGVDGVWWIHNDSGGLPTVYAINGRGQLLATVVLLMDGAYRRAFLRPTEPDTRTPL